ncbi:copia-like retroelement pol polyprotein [Lasius niger]|uniref:Copia-like retroelement pol polyprotein n=1 Tax=Lasius niger TaxID=67767 RepID=A0A0J7NFL0_LASNI|nr:copia-like retroelement pol polyprotein [Lasius niger]
MRCQSLGKARYFATFIDNASRCEVRFLKTKDEVFEAFKEVKALIENQKGKKVKFLQSDNGNGRFNNFLDIIGSRMVLRNKFGADGKLQRRKA